MTYHLVANCHHGCIYRRKTSKSSKDSMNDFAVSTNMAYGEVNLKPMEAEGEYENPDTIILKPSGQENIEAWQQLQTRMKP